MLWFIAAMFAGIIAHELIHCLTAVWHGRVRWLHFKYAVALVTGSLWLLAFGTLFTLAVT